MTSSHEIVQRMLRATAHAARHNAYELRFMPPLAVYTAQLFYQLAI